MSASASNELRQQRNGDFLTDFPSEEKGYVILDDFPRGYQALVIDASGKELKAIGSFWRGQYMFQAPKDTKFPATLVFQAPRTAPILSYSA